jgi:hypothetical protein
VLQEQAAEQHTSLIREPHGPLALSTLCWCKDMFDATLVVLVLANCQKRHPCTTLAVWWKGTGLHFRTLGLKTRVVVVWTWTNKRSGSASCSLAGRLQHHRAATCSLDLMELALLHHWAAMRSTSPRIRARVDA